MNESTKLVELAKLAKQIEDAFPRGDFASLVIIYDVKGDETYVAGNLERESTISLLEEAIRVEKHNEAMEYKIR
jgi:hypothetical protein